MRSLTEREKRALLLLIPALIMGWWLWPESDGPAPVLPVFDSPAAAERRVTKLRQTVAMVPGREQVLKQFKGELAVREAGLLPADTAAQAQALLLQIVARVARAQVPPVSIRSNEIGQVKPYGNRYGEVSVSVNFDMRIEQLVNLLADITAQKELIATNELRVGAANPKQKNMPVRLTFSGLVRRELIPDKKGSSF